MKRLNVRYRKSASNDLAQIGFHLEEVGASANVVHDYLARLRDACRRIADAPEAGRLRDDLLPGLRTWSFERRAVITYLIDPLGVRIVNVFHRGRDVEAFYARHVERHVKP